MAITRTPPRPRRSRGPGGAGALVSLAVPTDRGFGNPRMPSDHTRDRRTRATSSRLREISSKLFGKKSSAPASSASRVALAPSWVSEENINTGFGVAAMMARTALIPSMTGISMSMVTTSGLSARTLLMASRPSTANPTTLSRGSPSSISTTRRRKNVESSTTSTRTAMSRNPWAKRLFHQANACERRPTSHPCQHPWVRDGDNGRT